MAGHSGESSLFYIFSPFSDNDSRCVSITLSNSFVIISKLIEIASCFYIIHVRKTFGNIPLMVKKLNFQITLFKMK